jgi:hypothetical protein
MSNIKYTTKPIQPGSDGFATIPAEISCVFRFGKNDHYDQFIKQEPINELETEEKSKKQADNLTLATAAENAAIISIKNQLKLSSSLQVHSSDGSLISVFNTETVPAESSTYTNLETSFDLPIGDTSFIQQLLDNTDLSSPLPDFDLGDDLFPDLTNDSFLQFDPNMIQQLTDVPMEPMQPYPDHELSTLPALSANDETSISSVSSQQSDEHERDEINRRGIKKSGGPVRKLARFGNKQVIKYSDEYHDRRIKNNEAVKKSRLKAKDKQKSSEYQMNKLTEENRMLNDRVDLLMKELQLLRSLYKELKHDLPVESSKTLERINTH